MTTQSRDLQAELEKALNAIWRAPSIVNIEAQSTRIRDLFSQTVPREWVREMLKSAALTVLAQWWFGASTIGDDPQNWSGKSGSEICYGIADQLLRELE